QPQLIGTDRAALAPAGTEPLRGDRLDDGNVGRQAAAGRRGEFHGLDRGGRRRRGTTEDRGQRKRDDSKDFRSQIHDDVSPIGWVGADDRRVPAPVEQRVQRTGELDACEDRADSEVDAVRLERGSRAVRFDDVESGQSGVSRMS
ncbi:hypothetical protein AB0M80_23640, partial [Amycolatopsis sp. NPDC051045]|uniref:hypothetical protein n=1 Tax=Amycolatopsis sp. NPDC051045 TaxID=3156922 RepID=UPI00342C1D5C